MCLGKMKASLSILLVAVSLYIVSSEAAEVTVISIVDDVTMAGESNLSPVMTLPTINLTKGYLEEAELAIGAIIKSYHFSKYDYHDYNEIHNGVYISLNKWSAGTYQNSADDQSVFVTYNPNLYKQESFKVNLVAGVANGYGGWEYAEGDYLLLLGISTQWKYLKTVLAPDSVIFGIELPLNYR